MLVRDRRLSQAQLEAAIAQQARSGGRLGTVLVEMRLIDPETLTMYLGIELGIPVATNASLARAKRAAVKMLTPELAARHMCLPLVVQDRQLIVAMKDPHDLIALDELAAHTGYRIIPRVAPEVRLTYFIERFYGVPRPQRHVLLEDVVLGRGSRTQDDLEPPPPPLPGLPPVAKEVVKAPTPAPAVKAKPAGETTPEAVPDDLAAELEADKSAPAEAVKPAALKRAAPPPPPTETGTGEQAEALTVEAALAIMAEAQTRGEVAAALVGVARNFFDMAVVLVVKDNLAFGWRGFGRKLDIDRIETLMVPLEAPSMFRIAVTTDAPFVGAAPPSAIHAHLFKILRTSPPRQALVLPVKIKDRVVNLLYGQKDTETEISEEEVHAVKKVGKAASEAYIRLIAVQKQAR